MRKYIAALMAAVTVLSLSACGQKEEVQGMDYTISDVEVSPTLYTVGSAFDMVYSTAGYEDDISVFNEYLNGFDTDINALILELEGNPSTSITLSRILGNSGIKMSEVDWSTAYEIYDMPGFKDVSTPVVDTNVKLTLTPDRDKFVDIISHYGVVEYWNLLTATYPGIDVTVDRPDESFVDKLLYEWTIPDVESLYKDTVKKFNDSNLEVKLNSSTNSYYGIAKRNGFHYVSYYPYNSGKDGYIYMRDSFANSDIPLWQAYFCAYAAYLQGEYDVSVTSGVINNTTDGVEIWWSPSTGFTLSLYVYESGLIRITYGTDNRYSEYIDDVTDIGGSSSSTVKTALQSKLSSEFSMTTDTFESLITVAQVFNLPCAQVDFNSDASNLDKAMMQNWLDAAAIFNSYLKAVDSAHQSTITPYEFSIHLADFVCIGRSADEVTDIKFQQNLISTYADDEYPMSTAADVKPNIINDYQMFTDSLLDIVGSKSYFMIEGYNSFMTNITYVSKGEDRSEEITNSLQSLPSATLRTAEAVFGKVCSEKDFVDAVDGDFDDVDQSRVLNIIECLEEYSFTDESTIPEAVECILEWLAYGRSSVTKDNIYSIDKSELSTISDICVGDIFPASDIHSVILPIFDEAIGYIEVQGDGDGEDIIRQLFNTF